MSGIKKSSGNVYADLGHPDAEQMQVKASLATKIGEIIAIVIRKPGRTKSNGSISVVFV